MVQTMLQWFCVSYIWTIKNLIFSKNCWIVKYINFFFRSRIGIGTHVCTKHQCDPDNFAKSGLYLVCTTTWYIILSYWLDIDCHVLIFWKLIIKYLPLSSSVRSVIQLKIWILFQVWKLVLKLNVVKIEIWKKILRTPTMNVNILLKWKIPCFPNLAKIIDMKRMMVQSKIGSLKKLWSISTGNCQIKYNHNINSYQINVWIIYWYAN